MSLSVRWHRLEAATWLHRLLVLQVVLLGVATVVAFFAGLALGAPLLVLVPLGLTGVAGWFAQAWREERRWSWWAVLAVTALGRRPGTCSNSPRARPSGGWPGCCATPSS